MCSTVYDEVTAIIEGALKDTARILHGEPVQLKAPKKKESRHESSGKKFVFAKNENPTKLKKVRAPSSKTKSSSGKSRVTRKSQKVHSWGTTDYSSKKSIPAVPKSTIRATTTVPAASDNATLNGKLASSRCHSALNQIKAVPKGQKAFKSDVVYSDSGITYEVQLRGIIDSLTQKGKMIINGHEDNF